MNLKKIFPTICFTLLFLLPTITNIQANTIFPYKTEVLISNVERTREQFSFRNDSKKDINITPVIYSFDPKNVEIREEDGEKFVRADREIFTVKPDEILTIDFEIVPPENMEPGTYFNLIVLQQEEEDTFSTEGIPVGVIDSLSHLVVLHIVDSESSVFGITTEFAQISLSVIDKGIPFIRPTRIKYIYQNITNYVLSPMGEIQIFNEDSKYPPIYVKINDKEEKLYPGEIMEEEFDVKLNNFADLFGKRRIIGRFYNGIDDNHIIKETEQSPNYIFPIIVGTTLILTVILIKSLFDKDSKSKKRKTK